MHACLGLEIKKEMNELGGLRFEASRRPSPCISGRWIYSYIIRMQVIFQSPISTHGFIMSYIKENRQLAKPSSVSTRATRNREAKWIPPHAIKIKSTLMQQFLKLGERSIGRPLT
jgi:hypothetical protein